MFAISLVCIVVFFCAINAYSEYENSAPYTGPRAERYTSMENGALLTLEVAMYNFEPPDTQVVPLHNFAPSVYATNLEYRPLHNFWRGASYNTSRGY